MRETIRLNVVRRLPEGWLATIVNASASEVRVSARGIVTAQAWWRNDTIKLSMYRAIIAMGLVEEMFRVLFP